MKLLTGVIGISILSILMFIPGTHATTSSVVVLVIDDFQTGDYTLGREGTPMPYTVSDTQTDPSLTHIIGGERQVTFYKESGSTTQPYVNVCSTCLTGVSTFNSSFGCNAVWTMTYGATAPLNADFTTGAADAITLVLYDGDLHLSVPPRPVPVTVTVVSPAGSASVTRDIETPGDYNFFFTEFAGVDFSDVTQIVFELEQDSAVNDAVDFALEGFYTTASTVPVEESSWGAIKTIFAE